MYYYRYNYTACPACYYRNIMRLSRVSVRSFLPPRASRPRNIGTYVFTATRKTILFIIIVILAENASFKCKLRRHLLASMPLTTPKPQNTESTQRGHDITIRDFNYNYKNASFRSYNTFVHFFVRISSYKYAYLHKWVCSCRRV